MGSFYWILIMFTNFIQGRSDNSRCGPCVVPEYVTFEQKNFYIETMLKLTWISSVEYCNYIGMRLIAVRTTDEFVFLSKYLDAYGFNQDYWTSGNELHNKSEFRWFTTGEKIQNIDPETASPSTTTRTCLFLDKTRFALNQSNCTTKKLFICEKISSERC